jgi:flagellar biosynthesis protein FlhB
MRQRLKTQAKAGRQMAADWLADQGEDRAQVTNTAMNVVSLVVALTVGAIIAAFLLPIGIDELVAVDTSSWSNGATALWDILDVIIVLAVFLFFIAVALAAADRA